MCTNFERSGYEVLKLFDTDQPRTITEVYNHLYAAKTRMLLGATATIADYVDSLHCGRALEIKNEGYVLTPLGVWERDRLAEVIRAAS